MQPGLLARFQLGVFHSRVQWLSSLLCGGKPNRTISGVLELIRRFEFDFCRREKFFFFERFEFLVRSKFNHTQCGRACACAVACLCPRNSISNVVLLMTIHDIIKVFIHTKNKCKRCCKNMKLLWKVINIFMRADTYTFIHIHIHI